MANLSKRTKIIIWSVGGLILAIIVTFLALLILSRQAVNSYRTDAANQLNSAISKTSNDSAVRLKTVWLGDTVDSGYKTANNLQGDYAKLLASVQKYVAVLTVHNQLVEKYNGGLKGDETLNSDVLRIVNDYIAALEKGYPNEKDRIDELRSLLEAVKSNTTFDAISANINLVISSNDTWLSDTRDGLNSDIKAFQEKIN